MAKSLSLIASALCLLAFAGFVFGDPDPNEVFEISGKVYCDTCQIKFETRASYPIEDAVVKLVCRNATTEKDTLEIKDIRTDKDGRYTIRVDEDHTDEICDVIVVSSPDPKCNTIVPEIDSARLCLSEESGIVSKKRFANNIGFVAEKPIAICKEVVDELGEDFIREYREDHPDGSGDLVATHGPIDGSPDGPGSQPTSVGQA